MGLLKLRRKRAVAYYRHSREEAQEQSIPIQKTLIQDFALKNNIDIIHEESDPGISGLTSDRPGLQSLRKNWILNVDAPAFDFVLFLDVSRWGRWQDTTEFSVFENECTKNKKKIICVKNGMPRAENAQFDRLLLQVQETMAAEYSKNLSDKVFLGAIGVVQNGYSAGGNPPYALARLLLDEQRVPIRILKRRERKMISNQRVTLTLAEDGTVLTVKEIFHLFVIAKKSAQWIANYLNEKDVASPGGIEWSCQAVLRVLRNQTYIGSLVYNKTTEKLHTKKRKNPVHKWIIRTNAFSKVVQDELFEDAQERLKALYPSHRRSIERRIERARVEYLSSIVDVLVQKGFSKEDAHLGAKHLPLVFSVSTSPKSNNSQGWCFVLGEDFSAQSHVIGVGLDPDGMINEEKEHVFYLPVQKLRERQALYLKEGTDECKSYEASDELVQEKILTLISNNAN